MIIRKKSFELCRDVWFKEEPLLWPCIGDVNVEFRLREEPVTSIGVRGLIRLLHFFGAFMHHVYHR